MNSAVRRTRRVDESHKSVESILLNCLIESGATHPQRNITY